MFGFVILTHRFPEQLRRLISAINVLYDDPPIACHHDFHQSPLDPTSFPPNVHFVSPSLRTAWAKWSVVEATLAALQLLYRHADPDFALFLTGADYPTATRAKVAADLLDSGADAFVDGYSVQKALEGVVSVADPLLANFRFPHNVRLALQRYLRARIRIPMPRRATMGGWRVGAHSVILPFDSINGPFDNSYHCYFGAQFFTLKRGATVRVLDDCEQDRRLAKHMRTRSAPEEAYLQTILYNDPELKIDPQTHRYVDWSLEGAHPRDLDVGDARHALETGYHFARKFQPDDPALDFIDQALGISGARI